MLEKNKIDIYLRDLKDCQSSHATTSCDFCQLANNCQKKKDFESLVVQNLNEQSSVIVECQKSNGVSSCFVCKMVLECNTRNNYVNSVYLSMNRGNGGSFEF
ncbi:MULTISPECIES: hypothetical protein [Helicobacter]|uniref:Uncharacterized protein n=1 Tax=Helicobacter ibis TaxID=2962633 RepID=A0ABT4VBH2_9HELI|nr:MULTISPECIES: hypothetical protein [Helicobacter]MDA3966831.1 hypothetical protein [Helicobacter sp. WB40]MDA3968061.1 hypothetical protein [Helicobacter ibis]